MAKNQSEYTLHLTDKDGKAHVVGPGDDVPSWAKVTNPYVLGKEVEDDESGSSDGPPPRAGKGSGEDKWRAYADEKGFDVSEIEGRDEIIAALEAEGVPVE